MHKECYLRETLQHQDKSGGRKEDGKAAGPFWDPDSWNGFCKKTKSTAEQGCGIKEEIEREIEEITDKKRKSGHFERHF
jgi:hypothetical protein